jgi:hypothetical protein|tara:strand:- start:1166 stop:1396 length:231 start_codon:yes stop_codon:yes gene_type:complete
MNDKKMTYDQIMKLDIVNYDDLDTVVTDILTTAQTQVDDVIEKYNESNDDGGEVDTVDLNGKFDELHDYMRDYHNE